MSKLVTVLASLAILAVGWAQPTPAPVPTPLEPMPDVEILDLSLAERLQWTFALPPAGGASTEPVVVGETVYLAHSAYLLALAIEDGTVLRRIPLPGRASSVELIEGESSVRVTVDHGAAGSEELTLDGSASVEPLVFGVDESLFGGLRRAAAAFTDPAERAARDPTDPWVALEAARQAGIARERSQWLDRSRAAAQGLPFFELLPLAEAMLELGAPDHAQELYEAGVADLAARGYDPRLASDAALRDAYGFPEAHLARALEQGDLTRAGRIAPYAWRLAAEEAPGSVEVLRAYADALRDAGDRDEAGLWRGRARALDRSGLVTWVDAAALRLARLGWWGSAALLAAFALLWLVLLAKVWRAQTLARRQRRERGDRTWPWTRVWVARQASSTEKLALLSLLVLAGLYAGLASWQDGPSDVPVALRSGTLASLPAVQAVAALPDTPHALWVRGLSQLQRGDEAAARQAWQAAAELAPALVDLAVLRGDDPELLDAALAIDPREPVARFLTGRSDDPSPLHATTRADAPLWSVPSPLELRLAVAGDWRASLGRIVTEPWFALPDARPTGMPSLLWWPAIALYVVLLLTLTLSLAIPRPRVARAAPRGFGYHLGALLIPGSGHADELWGLLLLVPWSLTMADLLHSRQTGSSALGLGPEVTVSVLAALWAINLVGFAVELSSYRHRMQALREHSPELAISYGLRPSRPSEEV